MAKVLLPNRFEALQNLAEGFEALQSIVRPVTAALTALDEIYDDMEGAGQGAFLVLSGASGSGKSTFLHTLKLFREGVRTLAVAPEQPVGEALEELNASADRLRVIVLAGREAADSTTEAELDRALHAINQFLRTREGRNSLVVWPTNSETVLQTILAKAAQVGGEALLGIYPAGLRFEGPPKREYVDIARGTVQALNEGASLIALGVTETRATELAEQAPTLGAFLQSLREEERRSRTALLNLLPARERYNLWVVVVAGNDPEDAVGTLTSGAHFSADVDRLLASTDANVVQDLRRYPAKLGILGRSFDARILYVPFMTAMALVRDLADDATSTRLAAAGVPMKRTGDGVRRLGESQLARALRGEAVTTRAVGAKPGDDRRKEFARLTQFAKTDDGSLNRLFGEGLRQLGLVDAYRSEVELGAAYTRATDLFCTTRGESVRLEFMWRAETSVGEIAQYFLQKLYHYGKAIGFLNGH